jgi:hypothetical protein
MVNLKGCILVISGVFDEAKDDYEECHQIVDHSCKNKGSFAELINTFEPHQDKNVV